MENITKSTIIIGDCLKIIKSLPNDYFQTVVTSPPYWGVRDYKKEKQIGLEKTLDEYLNSLKGLFEQVFRVLRKNGTLWLNIGDIYTSGNRKYRAEDKKNKNRGLKNRPDTPVGLKAKDLIGIPWRLALILQSNKWYLRSEVIWSKPNPMPESVKDRPRRSHEHLFLFSKSQKYLCDFNVITKLNKKYKYSVWEIPVKGKGRNNIATFPEDLIRPCILSSTEVDDFVLDPFFGSGTTGQVCEQYDRKYVGIELNESYIKKNIHFLETKPTILYLK